MLKTRILTGAMLTVIIVLTIIFSHIPWVLKVAALCISLQSVYELYRVNKLYDNKRLYYISCLITLILSFINIPGYPYIMAVSFIASLIFFTYLMLNMKSITNLKPAITFVLGVMIAFFFNSMSAIRAMNNGLYLLLAAVLVSVITDIAAYFVGKGFGKHKLAPVISPKKTIEGSIGGTVLSTLILMIIAYILHANNVVTVDFGIGAIYLILASIIGQFGDLSMSVIKRINRTKDYGNVLPGHGGILDRFDSLLFVLPFTYLFFCLL